MKRQTADPSNDPLVCSFINIKYQLLKKLEYQAQTFTDLNSVCVLDTSDEFYIAKIK